MNRIRNRCSGDDPSIATPDPVGLIGQVSLTPVSIADHPSGCDRDFVSMTTAVDDDDHAEFVDVPTDVDMSGILDPVEVYQNLETATAPSHNY